MFFVVTQVVIHVDVMRAFDCPDGSFVMVEERVVGPASR